jgi:hypothetical protein
VKAMREGRKEGKSKIGVKGRKKRVRSLLRAWLAGAGVVNTRWEGTWSVQASTARSWERARENIGDNTYENATGTLW